MNCSNTRLLLNNLECEEWEEWVVRSVERWSMWNWTWTWSDDDWYNFKYFNISYYFHVHSDPFMFVCWCNSKASLRKYYKFISKQGNGEGWGVKEGSPQKCDDASEIENNKAIWKWKQFQNQVKMRDRSFSPVRPSVRPTIHSGDLRQNFYGFLQATISITSHHFRFPFTSLCKVLEIKLSLHHTPSPPPPLYSSAAIQLTIAWCCPVFGLILQPSIRSVCTSLEFCVLPHISIFPF